MQTDDIPPHMTIFNSYPHLMHFIKFSRVCVCMYSNSRNDVPRVAQRYGTIAAHTRCRMSVLVVFCVHMYSFAGLIRRTPPPAFSDTAITDRHSDTTIFQLRAHWVRISQIFTFQSVLLSTYGKCLQQCKSDISQ